MQAGEPAHPVQQSVVMARIRGLFLRVALPSPTDIGHSFSTMSNTIVSGSRLLDCNVRIGCYLNTARSFAQRPKNRAWGNCMLLIYGVLARHREAFLLRVIRGSSYLQRAKTTKGRSDRKASQPSPQPKIRNCVAMIFPFANRARALFIRAVARNEQGGFHRED